MTHSIPLTLDEFENAVDAIRDSMYADDRQTRQQLDAGINALNRLQDEFEQLRARILKLEAALRNLVHLNEEWNAAVETVIGRPVGWTADYLKEAKAVLGEEKK